LVTCARGRHTAAIEETDMAERHRPLREIAKQITEDWGARVNYAAAPYLEAMGRLDQVTDRYGHDDAEGIVIRFLGNARSWRGEVATEVKAELKRILASARG
jgi:hypothetical protein